MSLYSEIIGLEKKISLIGLGYVGLPIAVAFAKKVKVIGFDVNKEKIDMYKSGNDPTGEVGNEVIRDTTVEFTSDERKLKEAAFHIVAVPTPVNKDRTPDLVPLKSATKTIGRNLTKGSIVVFESTVYPGVTEEICIPILESESGLKCGVDFKVGYSPERINPGDQEHKLESIIKVVSGIDEETLGVIANVYGIVVNAGIYKAESIKVAEAAKVIENAQRDINIAFMNELSIIFNKMGIDTNAVLEAAGTKWNFMRFRPGLVGGHCIGIDPYYLTYKAEQLGYSSQIILSGRKINDEMSKYIAENTIKKMIQARKQINGAKIVIFGITFKENCPDVRNSKVVDLIGELQQYGLDIEIVDPVAETEALGKEYGLTLSDRNEIKDVDAVIFAVAHDQFKSMGLQEVKDMISGEQECVLIDVKGIYDKAEAEKMNIIYWRL